MKLTKFVLSIALIATGCVAGPEGANVRWSDAAPVQAPEPEPGAEAEPMGWLSIRTALGASGTRPRITDPVPTSYRRYAVFDADGRLVYRCDGHTTERDVILLPPGRYIVVASREGAQRQVQAVVEASRTTVVDLSQSP